MGPMDRLIFLSSRFKGQHQPPRPLTAEPSKIIDDPPPKPEAVVTGGDAAEANARVF